MLKPKKMVKQIGENMMESWLNYNLFVTSKNEFSNSPIHKFKVLQNVFKIKRLKMFFKVIIKNQYTIKKGF